MNGSKECIACQVQCRTEDKAVQIGEEFRTGVLNDSKDVEREISKMSQIADRIGCPKSEINRLRTLAGSTSSSQAGKRIGIRIMPTHPREIATLYAYEDFSKRNGRS